MRPRFRPRRRRTWPYVVFGLLVLLGLGHWFGGVYVTPPGDGAPGRTALVWRAEGEPFFNSPEVPGFEKGPAGQVLIEALPFWSYAYRQSRKSASRQEPVTVGGSTAAARAAPTDPTEPEGGAPDAAPSRDEAAAPAASPAPPRAAAPAPTVAPRTAETPRVATPRRSATPRPRAADTPAARTQPASARPAPSAPAVRAERDRRLERIRRELERIRREAGRPSSAGTRPSGAGG